MRFIETLLIGSLAIGTAFPQTAKGLGTLQGFVAIDGEGLKIRGAMVSAQSQYFFNMSETGPAEDRQPVIISTMTDEKGTYVFRNLKPGSYSVCAKVDGDDLLQPCEWERATHFAVQPSGLTPAPILVKRGRQVQVRIADPNSLLDTNEKQKDSGVHMLVGVWKDTVFYPARISATDKTARIYSVVVPFDTPVKLALRGENVSAQDAQGRAVAKDSRIDINEPKSSNRMPKTFDYAITGATPVGGGKQ